MPVYTVLVFVSILRIRAHAACGRWTAVTAHRAHREPKVHRYGYSRHGYIQAIHSRGFFVSLIPLSFLFPIFSFLTFTFLTYSFFASSIFPLPVSPRFLYFYHLEPRSSFTTLWCSRIDRFLLGRILVSKYTRVPLVCA